MNGKFPERRISTAETNCFCLRRVTSGTCTFHVSPSQAVKHKYSLFLYTYRYIYIYICFRRLFEGFLSIADLSIDIKLKYLTPQHSTKIVTGLGNTPVAFFSFFFGLGSERHETAQSGGEPLKASCIVCFRGLSSLCPAAFIPH